MQEAGRGPLGPFALYITRSTWIGGEPKASERRDVAWEGKGPSSVPITALRDGFIIFEFDKSGHYSGGSVPPYKLPEDRRIPPHVTVADRERTNVAYRRFVYMNAFLLALYSGISTVQRRGTPVQEAIDPTKYFGATQTDGKWETYNDYGRKIDYPLQRQDNIQLNTLDHSLEILNNCGRAIGPASLNILSLTYTACAHFSRHQFSSAHLIAWTIIEALLNRLWLNLQSEIDASAGGHTTMNKNRKKLLAGRDFSSSVVSQVLSICTKIDDETLNRLDEARRQRNAFTHGLSEIGADDARKAIQLATDMIAMLAGIRVTSQLSLSYWI